MISMGLSMSLTLPRKPKSNTLPSNLTAPKPTLTTLSPLLTRAFLTEPTASSAPSSLRQNNLEITLLGRNPPLDKACRILGQILVKLALRVGLVELLHEEGEVVVGADDGLQVCEVGFRGGVFVDVVGGWVGEGDSDVVDGWGGGFGFAVGGWR
jgi:hypothetical protein